MGYGAATGFYQLPNNPLGPVEIGAPGSYGGFVNPGIGSAARMSGMADLLPPPPVAGAGGSGFLRSLLPESAGGLASRALPALGGVGMFNAGNNFAPSDTRAALLHGGGLGMIGAGAAGSAVPTLPFTAAAAAAAGNSQLGNAIGQHQAAVNAREGGTAGKLGQASNLAQGVTSALSGNPTGLGQVTGALGVQSPVEAATGLLSKLPGIGGLFNQKQEPQAAAASPDAQLAEDTQRVARTPGAIVATMKQMGIGHDYQTALMADYQSNIAYLQAQAAAGIPQQVNTQDPKDPSKTVTVSKVLTPDEISMAAYQDVMGKIPAIQAQQQSDTDMTRRTAATQAAIAQWMPQVVAPYNQAAAGFGGAYNSAIDQLAPGMQGAAHAFANTATGGNGALAASYNNALALIPGYLAQQQHDSQVSQLQQQLIASEIQRQIAAGKGQAGSTDDALTAALTG